MYSLDSKAVNRSRFSWRKFLDASNSWHWRTGKRSDPVRTGSISGSYILFNLYWTLSFEIYKLYGDQKFNATFWLIKHMFVNSAFRRMTQILYIHRDIFVILSNFYCVSKPDLLQITRIKTIQLPLIIIF